MSIQFFVTDLERSIEYYKKLLGFDIDFRYEDFYIGIVNDGYSKYLKSGKSSLMERKQSEQ